jgi:hypothetical protein
MEFEIEFFKTFYFLLRLHFSIFKLHFQTDDRKEWEKKCNEIFSTIYTQFSIFLVILFFCSIFTKKKLFHKSIHYFPLFAFRLYSVNGIFTEINEWICEWMMNERLNEFLWLMVGEDTLHF